MVEKCVNIAGGWLDTIAHPANALWSCLADMAHPFRLVREIYHNLGFLCQGVRRDHKCGTHSLGGGELAHRSARFARLARTRVKVAPRQKGETRLK